ncbi:hypothetical protein HanPSC8_Chr09g0388101 [Helianthus annuus]|nr:hypothetical protein HanPSC8_Chr09g0388101 [Helianthus annuus]
MRYGEGLRENEHSSKQLCDQMGNLLTMVCFSVILLMGIGSFVMHDCMHSRCLLKCQC